MKRTLVAALASLMLAGVLAGATEPVMNVGPSAIFSLSGSPFPVLLNAPFALPYGDSMSH
jgi:hypothetical protein